MHARIPARLANLMIVSAALVALSQVGCETVEGGRPILSQPAPESSRQESRQGSRPTAPPTASRPAKPPTNRINPTHRGEQKPVAAVPTTKEPARQPAPFDSVESRFDFGELLFETTFTQEDFDAHRMNATVTYTVWPRADDTSVLTLNTMDMRVTSVEAGSDFHETNFIDKGDSIEIDLEGLKKAGEGATVRIHYTVTQPQLGLYFAGAGDDFCVYTFSEGQQARFWLPSHDYPNTRWSAVETRITVPDGLMAVSVGAPVGEPATTNDGAKTYIWRLNSPIDTHLCGFTVGRFQQIRLDDPGHVPIFAYVQPRYEKEARAAFGEIGRIVAYYESLVGVAYPFPQLSFVSTPGHFHDGMEQAGYNNISPNMYVKAAGSDRTRYEYIAHMIGHAWFGGITNYEHVTEAWMNEGFATYLHLLWRSQTDDFAAFDRDMAGARRRILGHDEVGKSHPIVNTTIRTPGEIYDFGGGLIYFKGAWVLHMLRAELGDATFWRCIREFLERERGQGVSTKDFQDVMSSVSGRDLSAFFAQWVYRDGSPHLKLEHKWDAERGVLVLRVKQTQRLDAFHPPFFFPLTVELESPAGKTKHTVRVTKSEEAFEIPSAQEPVQVTPDPDTVLLAKFGD